MERRGRRQKLVKNFLEERSQKVIDSNLFPCTALLNLFIKYNTRIPSSAAVKRS